MPGKNLAHGFHHTRKMRRTGSVTEQNKMADGTIPVVDFDVMGLNNHNPAGHDEESVKVLADKIYTAFSTIGFVYLTNHGISDAEVTTLRRYITRDLRFYQLFVFISFYKLIPLQCGLQLGFRDLGLGLVSHPF